MSRIFILAGALAGVIGVILGAFAAHGLKGKLADRLLAAFQTGVEYQMYHALVLILVGILIYLHPTSQPLKWAGYLFLVGILLFSGSLYGLALTEIKMLGPVTPLGGLTFILGWLTLAYAAIQWPHNV